MINVRNVLLWVHIVVALVTMGPFLLFDVISPGLVRARNAATLRTLERLTKVLGPLTVLIPAAGIAMVIRNDGYDFSQAWVAGALAGYVFAVANGIGILGKTVTRAVERIEAGEDATAEATRLRVFGTTNI